MPLTRRSALVFLAVIGVLEYAIYFWRAGHFFQGDTLSWFYYRLTSMPQFWRSFVSLDVGGWYRPLTNRTLQSLLYPVWGLAPGPYRPISFALFLADTAAVLAIMWRLTRNRLAAMIGTLLFAVHTINAYTTYDLSFTPELVYTLFYICAVLAFLSHLENRSAKQHAASVLFFALSLCSKEAAVTLPLTLAVLGWLRKRQFRTVAAAIVPHVILLAVYGIFIVGHLGVASEALASLRSRPAQIQTGGYYFFFGRHIFTNAALALAWALNLPVGMLGEWRLVTRLSSLFLWGFAVLQAIVILYALARRESAVLEGLAWFGITLLPALPLFAHFLPYYLFLPIVGFTLMSGAAWARAYGDMNRILPVWTTAAFAATAAVLIFVCARSARSEARNNFLLGGSSRIAETCVKDLLQMYPRIPSGTTVFVNSDAQPDLWYHHAEGHLFNLVYKDDSIQFQYSSLNPTVPDSPLDEGKTIRLIYRDGHLVR